MLGGPTSLVPSWPLPPPGQSQRLQQPAQPGGPVWGGAALAACFFVPDLPE